MASEAVKLTISLPEKLLKVTDEIAKERKISRSKIISACLQELADKRLQENMAEGYRVLAKEHSDFAEDSLPLAHEIVHHWK
jgi:metal-responsive CopG/Arc/MetJ family transcriptional regulator